MIDEPFSLDDFKLGLKPFRGEVKGVLTRGRLVSGIGNAYADEILYEARPYPFKITAHELVSLHRAVYSVPAKALRVLRERVGDKIHRKCGIF